MLTLPLSAYNLGRVKYLLNKSPNAYAKLQLLMYDELSVSYIQSTAPECSEVGFVSLRSLHQDFIMAGG